MRSEAWRPRLRVVNLYAEPVGNPEVPEKFQTAEAAPTPVRVGAANAVALLVVARRSSLTVVLFSRFPATDDEHRSGEKHRGAAVRQFQRRSGQRVLRRRHSDEISDALIQDRRSEGHLAHFHAALQRQARKLARDRRSNLASPISWKEACRRAADAVRVNVQLIKAANDSHLWAETYDRKLTDIFSVESEVAKAIADAVASETHRSGRASHRRQADRECRGLQCLPAGLAYNLNRIHTGQRPCAQRNISEKRSGWTRSSPLPGRCCRRVSARLLTQSLQPTVALREEARQAAETALTLQPNLGEAIWPRAITTTLPKDYDTAVRYFEQARQFCRMQPIPESLAVLSHGGAASGTGASRTSTKPSGSIRATFACSASKRNTYRALERFPAALRKLDQDSRYHPDDVDSPGLTKRPSLKPQGDLRSTRGASRSAALPAKSRPFEQKLPAILERARTDHRSAKGNTGQARSSVGLLQWRTALLVRLRAGSRRRHPPLGKLATGAQRTGTFAQRTAGKSASWRSRADQYGPR